MQGGRSSGGKSNECDGEETRPNKQKTSSREIETFEKKHLHFRRQCITAQPKNNFYFGPSLED